MNRSPADPTPGPARPEGLEACPERGESRGRRGLAAHPHPAPDARPPHPDADPFSGFPNYGEPTVVPNVFFARVLPEITDPAELAVTLYVMYAAGQTKRRPRYVTHRELEAEGALMRTLAHLTGGDGESLARGLHLAVHRGTLIRAQAEGEGDTLYAVNNPSNRKALERLAGEGAVRIETLPPALAEAAPNVYSLYEDNIGPITPLIADDLRDAEERYPAQWLSEAFREAVELNKRSWRYVQRILERWETEGRSHEEHGRDHQADWLARRYREGKTPPGDA